MRTLRYRCLLAIAIMITASTALSQNKLDVWLKDAITTYREEPAKLSKKLPGDVRVDVATGRPMVNVILQTLNGDFSFVRRNGGTLRTVAGPYATALLPLEALEEISSLAEVAYVSGTVKLQQLNDLATQTIGSRAAIAAGYTGDDVLIGIIDSGIDIKHPGFKNATGTRILYLWDQSESLPGQNPAYPVYDYGVEWKKTQIDQGLCTSKDTDGHGTHVAGSIAQYIPSGPDSAYNGSAIAANLIIVKTNYRNSEILDGINYIFEKARQLGKPAIINISLGSQLGPHDGLDPFVAAQDYLTGPGRLIVQSAGNDGNNPIHDMVTADGNGEDMEFTISKTASVLKFELWYEGNQSASIQILGPGVTFPIIASGDQKAKITSSRGNATVDNASDGPEYYNADKRISVTLENAAAGSWRFRLSSASATVVHAWMWEADTSAHFKFATNDYQYTLVNDACARTNIVVGAAVTRNRFRVRDYPPYPDGTEFITPEIVGELASFTSSGPTRDGREKPDIVAPGTMVASALSADISGTTNSGAAEFRSIGPRYPVFGAMYQQFMQGTSMSAPVAAGAIAQMSKRRPQFDYTMVKSYLKRFSKNVGSAIAGIWHPRAGHGMINMQALVDNKIQVTALAQTAGNKIFLSFNKPPIGADNPANYSLIGPSSGRKVINAQVDGNVVTLTLDGNLVEGESDLLQIQNVSAVAGLQAFAEVIEVEIDKIGTIVAPHHILTNEIWHREEGPYYIHGRVEIPDSVGGHRRRLTIEPGTVVKFMPNASDSSRLVVFGELVAHGTKEAPIVFTSLNQSKNGEWDGIYFDTQIPPTTLKFCEIRYADDGIVCLSSNLIMEDCKISHSLNTGFFAQDCSPTIKRTIIWDSKGGQFADGIQLSNASSATLVENVTIHGNARIGIACFSSNPQIINSIVSNNVVAGIHSQNGLPPVVTYSDVWGNGRDYSNFVPGVDNNISSDPKFVNAANGDFHLLQNSPCINAGNPNSEKDPDGSRRDMGALFYDSRPDNVTNFTAKAGDKRVDLSWTDPADDRFAGVLILRSVGGSVSGVPQYAISYELNQTIGNAMVIYKASKPTPGNLADMALTNDVQYFYKIFPFSKIPSYASGVEVSATPITSVSGREHVVDLPTIYDLQQNYPNPFNPSTIIAFDLPKASEVQLSIYDLQGQLIRTLLKAWRPAGRYKVEWDGKGDSSRPVSSGIYIIHLRAGTFEKTQKAILVK